MQPVLREGAFFGLGVAVKDVITQLSKAFRWNPLFVCQNLCKIDFQKHTYILAVYLIYIKR